jgi:hypothetical protein
MLCSIFICNTKSYKINKLQSFIELVDEEHILLLISSIVPNKPINPFEVAIGEWKDIWYWKGIWIEFNAKISIISYKICKKINSKIIFANARFINIRVGIFEDYS